jgi:hypothetical protein
MKGDIQHILEDSSNRDTRLNGVFNKISDIWQHQNSVSRQKMSSEVIESILPERFNVPVAVSKYFWYMVYFMTLSPVRFTFVYFHIRVPHFNIL